METQTNQVEKVNSWVKNSVTLKLVVITVLMLLLLIPSSMIQGIIREREYLNEQAINDVNSKWAESQCIAGPILTIPIEFEETKENKVTKTTHYYHILPEELNIKGTIEPEKLKRGIHEVVVYRTLLSIDGRFDLEGKLRFSGTHKINYEDAFLTIGVSDLRGIKDEIVPEWGDKKLSVTPGSRIPSIISSGITIYIPDLVEQLSTNFDLKLHLKGSQNLSMIPVGSVTNVALNSTWADPSFNGNFLPDSRTVNENGFTASWKILQLNRNYPQTWFNNESASQMNASAFGLNLILPVDDYQKSIRSSKYDVMMITLTFLVFFLVEVLNKRKIHPFQYILIGLGLCLFYTLLVSISEHLDFNIAYFISAGAIIAMISIYSLSVFKSKKFAALILSTLVGIYGFLFVTLQLTDYALLMGSIGLTIILGATMYFTRKINWYTVNISEE